MGIPTRHKVSGAIDKNTPEHYLEHPALGKNLEVVSEGTKPFLPEMHRAPAEVKEPEAPTVEVEAPAKTFEKKKNSKDNHGA